MGFYIRKSINVGPFRFNLSGSGVGVSTGIRGLRIGTGPRGNYVHMGAGGVYFRQTIPNLQQSAKGKFRFIDKPTSNVEMTEIERGDVSQMVDSSSAALLDELNYKHKKLLIWPFVLILESGILLLLIAFKAPVWLYFLIIPLFGVGLYYAVQADILRKTVVLFYNLEPDIETAFQQVYNAFNALQNCSKLWLVSAKGDLWNSHDRKINAGAGALIRRNQVSSYFGSPAYFKCNISIPVLPAGRQCLYFLPDRILVWDSARVGAINYDQIDLEFRDRRFIESEGVPPDSKVVDHTWRYVNKDGGPDRRFNDNRQIPITLYEEVLITSISGLQEMYQISKTGIGSQLKSMIKQMVLALSYREAPPLSQDVFVKCPCNNCNTTIEFPERGSGEAITCPRCGRETVLFKPDREN